MGAAPQKTKIPALLGRGHRACTERSRMWWVLKLRIGRQKPGCLKNKLLHIVDSLFSAENIFPIPVEVEGNGLE
jgi:hypothetical protein